jgi:hypothetical protein
MRSKRWLSDLHKCWILLDWVACTACDDDDDKPAAAHGDHAHDGADSGSKPSSNGAKDSQSADSGAASYALCSVVIDADGNRTTYVQSVSSLDEGPFDNKSAIEIPRNGVVMTAGKYFLVGLIEEPT